MWIALAAAVTALVTWTVTPPLTPRDLLVAGWDASRGALADDPPPRADRDWIVPAYMQQTEEASFWSRPPLMLAPSAELMRARFDQFDPRRPHRYRRTGFQLWIPDLVRTAPLFAGIPIEVIGRTVNANVLAPPVSPKGVEWVIQLAPITVNDGLVYCRVTAPLSRQFRAGSHLVASGTVIAAGSVDLTRGGKAPAAYMACSAVQRPYGQIARFTKLLEDTGIDIVSIYQKAETEREFNRLWAKALLRSFRENPSRIANLRLPVPGGEPNA